MDAFAQYSVEIFAISSRSCGIRYLIYTATTGPVPFGIAMHVLSLSSLLFQYLLALFGNDEAFVDKIY